MPKNIVQDVVPPQKSIRNIPLPPRRRTPTRSLEKVVEKKLQFEPSLEPSRQNHTDSKIWIFFLLFAFVFIIVFSVMSFFAGATIAVTPNQGYVTVEKTLKASNDNSTSLLYQLAKTELVESTTVKATETKQVEERARGEVIVYNNHSTSNQRLITNTRFESSSGLIYRIEESVIVPGRKTVNGKVVPGSAKAKIIAEDAGEKYNGTNIDFTLPGFKGLPQYKNIYARSSTEIQGGYIGEVRVVATEVKQETRDQLENTLREKIKKEIAENVPAQFITYDSTLDITFEELPDKSENGGVTVSLKGIGHTLLFDRENLTQELAKNASDLKIKTPVNILNLEELTILIKNGDTWRTQNGGVADIDVKGKLYMVSRLDDKKIIEDIKGVKKSEISKVFKAYPQISKANVSIKPLWKRAIPTEPEKIRIIQAIDYKKGQ